MLTFSDEMTGGTEVDGGFQQVLNILDGGCLQRVDRFCASPISIKIIE